MSIELALSVLGLAVIALAIPLSLAIYYGARASDRKDTAQAGQQASDRAQRDAEMARDQEHTARVAAEAQATSLTTQLAATQTAANAVTQERLQHVHDAILNGPPDVALAAFRSVFPLVSGSGSPANAPAGGGAAQAAAVQPASG